MSAPRLMTAMITPYYDNLEVNFEKAGEIAEHLCNTGSEGIVVCGTTGESPVLSVDEKLQLFAAIKAIVGKRVAIWAGTGSNDTRQTIELSRNAEKYGVDGIMLVTPYYNKPSQEGLYQHFKKIAESVSVPVMVYNVPGRTGTNLMPSTVARLAEVENITAIKEASGNMDQVSELKKLVSDKIMIYSGDDPMTLPMMALGAQGVVSIASHLVGMEIRNMIEAFVAGDFEKALDLHLKLFPIFKGLFVTTNPVPLKEALNLVGMNVGGLRPPLCSADENARAFLKELLISNNILK